jgi:hypothetical protein
LERDLLEKATRTHVRTQALARARVQTHTSTHKRTLAHTKDTSTHARALTHTNQREPIKQTHVHTRLQIQDAELFSLKRQARPPVYSRLGLCEERMGNSGSRKVIEGGRADTGGRRGSDRARGTFIHCFSCNQLLLQSTVFQERRCSFLCYCNFLCSCCQCHRTVRGNLRR